MMLFDLIKTVEYGTPIIFETQGEDDLLRAEPIEVQTLYDLMDWGLLKNKRVVSIKSENDVLIFLVSQEEK